MQTLEAKTTDVHPDTPAAVVEVLERARRMDTRIRVYYGDPETGRDWMEEWDNTGYVSRSTGIKPIYILVHNRRSMGGGAISTRCILRITTSAEGRELYRHPKYQRPDLTLQECAEIDGYTWEVLRDGETHARFSSRAKAEAYIIKMTA